MLDDLDDLDGAERKLVFKALKELTTEPGKRGVPLGSDLTTFRKLGVGNRRFRIVFRVEADGTVVVVWVIASRVDGECYELAMARLALCGNNEVASRLKEAVKHAFGEERPRADS
ncbi:type II toxin-antitoxin system RelE family toxin [Amycolatopsis pigmentata]|uniref:Type II toxin-antitoxin system RelE/ParE family toxin n=1 Tax=Amycolatopsis pigmentata TaxID=450801 RepID=A0ABW5FWZ2_9PSEU